MMKLADIEWPAEYSELKRIEELLVCGICYNYMETSVMTPCSHNYCSLCIRKFLHYKNQCPACFQDTFEKDLHTNRILDEIIQYFTKIRDKLVNCISGARVSTDNNQLSPTPNTPPVRPARSNHVKSPEISKPVTPPDKPASNVQSPVALSNPSTSSSSKVAKLFTPKARKTESKAALVPCPVCKVEISELHINKHLDDCLKRESMPQRPARIETKRKPLPKLVLCLMKDLELKKKMKALSLSIRGDRKTLENRYFRYCTLYNAECDKLCPRSIEEILKQCEEEEEQERLTNDTKQNVFKLTVSRNASQNVIDSAQKQYLETNRDKFDSLIQQIRNRKGSKVRRSLIEEEEKPKSEDNWDSQPVLEAAFQDNDSNDSCFLQTYTSEHPMSYLSLQMSDDSNSPKKATGREEEATSPSVFDQTTDAETDSDAAGDDAIKGTMKRPKLNPEEEKIEENGVNDVESHAPNLILPIAQDASDDCSNGSSVDMKSERKSDSSQIDKENETANDNGARRPLRKRNHPSRFGSQEVCDSKGSQPTRLVAIDALKEEINGNKALLSSKGDATMKRRRRRKGLEPGEKEAPPRRPIRKRDGNLLQDGANEAIIID